MSTFLILLMSMLPGLGKSFWVSYKPDVVLEDILVHDLSILSAEVRADLKAAKARGGRCLGYISVVEANPSAGYFSRIAEAGISVPAKNAQWNNPCVDITDPKWHGFVIDKLAKPLMEKGFSGFFLDTVDSIHFLKEARPDQAKAIDEGMVELIRKLRAAFPEAEIVVNRGFDLLPQIGKLVNGVMIESVYRTFNKAGEYTAVAPETTKVLESRIQKIRAAGLPVYVLDYLQPENPRLADSVAEQIRKTGAEPFLTTKDLQGAMLGPIRRQARRILVIFGAVLGGAEVARKFEPDTFTAERLQMPLEWMGYEVEYLNVGKISPPQLLDDRFAGVIFDLETQLPFGGEAWYVDWILEQRARGKKILFTGDFPFQQEVQKARLLKGLGLWGSFAVEPYPKKIEFRLINKDLMNFEASVVVHPSELEDTRAPEGASIDLSVTCKDAAANTLVHDVIFTTPWGGVVLEPYATFQATADDQASLFDPFKFLHRIFPGGQFPAPDTTTRDGRRIFYSHIDGDGFAGVSPYAGKKICAETVRDTILSKYPFPITVSLIEAHVRGLEPHQDFADVPGWEEIARSILALPNIQAASHAFSHPYVWIDDDEEYVPLYETRGLVLKPEAKYDSNNPDMKREILGSIDYVNTLCPPGKKAELMLWSGNCRPGAEALRVCREAGIENMNGGETVISKRHPFLSNVSSRIMTWDGELQVHAANQNEFVYTRNWRGPFFGGFRKLIETFEMTEKPRRLKPANIYYHFYSSATQGALRSLEQVHDWCLEQPLHSMTAVEYARVVRDSYYTYIYPAGNREWILLNQGKLRTFRVPAAMGVPDLQRSVGVTGSVKFGDALYIHTDGSRKTRLVLADQSGDHLFLESSQGEITWSEFSSKRLHLKVNELRPKHLLVIGGAKPSQDTNVTVDGKTQVLKADAAGRVEIPLSGSQEVRIEG